MKRSLRPRPPDVDALAGVADVWERLRRAARVVVAVTEELEAATRIRDGAMVELHASGSSYQAIAQHAGLTRGRVAQIVRRGRSE